MTMISKINRIQNLGLVFSDYRRESDLPVFRRFNLLYGWNGTGKTTFSQLFQAITGETVNDSHNLRYEFTDDSSNSYRQDTLFTVPIKVFNKVYIEKNFEFLQGNANSLYLLVGESSKVALEEIRKDERTLNGDPADSSTPGMRTRLRELQNNLSQKEKDKAVRFTSIARTIGAAMVGRAYRTYRKQNAEADFSQLQSKKELSDDAMSKYLSALKQDSMPDVPKIELNVVTENSTESQPFADAIAPIVERAESLLKTTIDSAMIERLRNNPDIAKWVEAGLKLHSTHSSEVCEYCLQSIPEERFEVLQQHFNEQDQKLKQELTELSDELDTLSAVLETFQFSNKAQFYKELQEEYESHEASAKKAIKSVLNQLNSLSTLLSDKKTKTSVVLNIDNPIDCSKLDNQLSLCNDVIRQHNDKSSNLEKIKGDAAEKIKTHWLSTIFDEVKSDESAIKKLKLEINVLENGDDASPDSLGIRQLEERIKANRQKVSSSAKACKELNKGLRLFLGHDEIEFTPSDESEEGNEADADEESGLRILRRGEPASALSEGEKTAIAFVYFTIDLRDPEFDLKKGIVVLDDPISSLDIDMLYRTCTFIEKRLNNVKQLFVFTHNYDFFNQVKKWFRNEFTPTEEGELPSIEHFMLENKFDSTKNHRVAMLSPLDPLLRDFDSEYHYLFKKLLTFEIDNPQAEGTRIAAIYNYPNIARKFLECFLAYRVPTRGSFYSRLMGLKRIEKTISSDDLGIIYNFVNSHSHLDTKSGLLQFDPTLTQTGRECIALVLKLIEMVDGNHFKMMKKAVEQPQLSTSTP